MCCQVYNLPSKWSAVQKKETHTSSHKHTSGLGEDVKGVVLVSRNSDRHTMGLIQECKVVAAIDGWNQRVTANAKPLHHSPFVFAEGLNGS